MKKGGGVKRAGNLKSKLPCSHFFQKRNVIEGRAEFDPYFVPFSGRNENKQDNLLLIFSDPQTPPTFFIANDFYGQSFLSKLPTNSRKKVAVKEDFEITEKIVNVVYEHKSQRMKNWCMMSPEMKSCNVGESLEGG